MTAGREDGTASPVGQLETSHADREQMIDVLKAAFVQGRLTKEEFDFRGRPGIRTARHGPTRTSTH